MSLEIFKKYIDYYKKNNENFFYKVKNVFLIDEEEDTSLKFLRLSNQNDFEQMFANFMRESYSNNEQNDYYVLFHLLNNHILQQTHVILSLRTLGHNQYYKVVQEFISKFDNYTNKIDVNHRQDFIDYLRENHQIKTSWKNLIKNLEPGLIVNLAVMGENVDCLFVLQDNNLTNEDVHLLKSENKRLKTFWVQHYLNQKNNQNLAFYDELSFEDYMNKNSGLISCLEMLKIYIGVHGLIFQRENINLLKNLVRNLELFKVAKENRAIYLNTLKKFDTKCPKYSVFMTKDWDKINELLYMDTRAKTNKVTKKQLLKF